MKFSESYYDDIRYFDKTYKRVLLVGFIILMYLIPVTFISYVTYVLSLILIYSIVTVGLNILMGYTGQISLGHASFMAIGAYSSAILMERVGFSYWLALPASGLITAIAGIMVGPTALRIKGLYLALVTMCFGFLVDVVIVEWSSLTNGVDGMFHPEVTLGPIVFDTDLKKYYLILTVTIVMLLMAKNIIRTRIGRAFVAIRDSDIAAETMGIDLAKYKIISFGVSTFFAGIAGSLFALLVGYIGPDNFTLIESVSFLIMVVIGGTASILGSILGAAFITVLPEAIRFFKDYIPSELGGLKGLESLIYGAVLVLFIL
ncbi:MAG: branched-chain amino acid ABC transporter permease, partial [bacterium]|nr:branched-chain amino acid ABC transporter permease [bacterium]